MGSKCIFDIINNIEFAPKTTKIEFNSTEIEMGLLNSLGFVIPKKTESRPQIDKAYFNHKTNQFVIKTRDGETYQSTLHNEDNFDPYVGFALAYCSAVFGSKTKFRKFVDKKYIKNNKKEVK